MTVFNPTSTDLSTTQGQPMDTTANGNSHPADELTDAFEAFDAAGYEEEVLYGYEPQVLYDKETGEVRIIVVVPVEGGEQQIHIPLDDEGMIAVVNGLAEARGAQPRIPMPARSPLTEDIDARGGEPQRSRFGRMIDPGGLGGLIPDDLPPTIFGVPSNRMIAYIVIAVVVISFLLMILL
ncbi:hypothetical protein [Rhodococcus opacus]|uniref:Integral membrane protein n=2 Tax=Rhodococcus opacus TaxID=37919 RepID=A0AAX3YQ03_RHOOP|nr:hypothetical protein [Rhodococcus opacus]WLF51313.1 hypothetical protein Q5707_38785 [Rhodococcus opacus]